MNTRYRKCRDIIKIAMVKVHGELKKRKLKSRLILQVHDELIVETFKDEKEEVEKILLEGMQNAVSLKVRWLWRLNRAATGMRQSNKKVIKKIKSNIKQDNII